MYQLVYADPRGRYFDHGSLGAVGRTGDMFVEIEDEDVVQFPAGASLVLLPGGHPVGINQGGRFNLLDKSPRSGIPAFAVGALLPQGYTRTLLPAFRRSSGKKPLPLMGYAAVAWRGGQLFVAARRTDNPERWDPVHYNTDYLPELVEGRLRDHPGNRILRQLSRCALEYSCFTAQNIFFTRWEGGVPVSPACNARCLGCISKQPAECCPSPQERINFHPAVDEVVEIMAHHLENAPAAITSFGQGCEGEPALAAETIVEAVHRVRGLTDRGTINMNSNAGYTQGIREVCEAGLDSIRVSLISAREEVYNAYYRPRDYSLSNVRQSIMAARENGVYVSLNLLVFPGLTDREEETEALCQLIQETGVNMVQLRNLNIDPDFLLKKMPPEGGEVIGIPAFVEQLRTIPDLQVGNFSRAIK